MAVAQYPFPVVGGLERQAHELAKELSAQGLEVAVLSGQVIGGSASSEIVDGIAVHRLPWAQSPKLRVLKTAGAILTRMVLERRRYDVVHVHSPSWFGVAVILAARALGLPVISKLPNIGVAGLPGMRSRRFGRLLQSLYLRSDAMVAMSKQSLTELKDAGYPDSRVFLTPNGIVPSAVRPTKNARDGGPVRVVFVGRLHEQKRLHDLLAAWAGVVRRSAQRVRLELWGEGPQRAQLEDLAKQLPADADVVFRGHVWDVRAELQDADIFVLPSEAEGNSNAILEAMAAGLPIVSTRIGGTPMLVGDIGATLLVEAGDRNGLEECLLRAIAEPQLRAELGTAMSKRVEMAFEIRGVAAGYARVYEALATGRRDDIAKLSNAIVLESHA
jgi:glycosyltransferase involved in cell wall biosynthesis